MKRLLSKLSLIVISLLLLILTACGNQGGKEQVSTDTGNNLDPIIGMWKLTGAGYYTDDDELEEYSINEDTYITFNEDGVYTESWEMKKAPPKVYSGIWKKSSPNGYTVITSDESKSCELIEDVLHYIMGEKSYAIFERQEID